MFSLAARTGLVDAPETLRGSGDDVSDAGAAAGRVLRALLVVYIALIGAMAIEELERREQALKLIEERVETAAMALAALDPAGADDVRRKLLVREAASLRRLEVQTRALILGGPVTFVGRDRATVKQILCELAALEEPDATCVEPRVASWWLREAITTAVLKRPAESTASGNIFAILVLVAAAGGALVRLYLPDHDESDAYRTVLRALGGGMVCYLAVSGGSLPLTDAGVTAHTSAATASLLGFLSGMFATRVFQLLSDVVDRWMDRLTPRRDAEEAPGTWSSHSRARSRRGRLRAAPRS